MRGFCRITFSSSFSAYRLAARFQRRSALFPATLRNRRAARSQTYIDDQPGFSLPVAYFVPQTPSDSRGRAFCGIDHAFRQRETSNVYVRLRSRISRHDDCDGDRAGIRSKNPVRRAQKQGGGTYPPPSYLIGNQSGSLNNLLQNQRSFTADFSITNGSFVTPGEHLFSRNSLIEKIRSRHILSAKIVRVMSVYEYIETAIFITSNYDITPDEFHDSACVPMISLYLKSISNGWISRKFFGGGINQLIVIYATAYPLYAGFSTLPSTTRPAPFWAVPITDFVGVDADALVRFNQFHLMGSIEFYYGFHLSPPRLAAACFVLSDCKYTKPG